ncbi:MAG: hypothetical protein ACYST3_09765 [Planctomycetota bacterium]|jgi:hypothetical protein
MGNKKLFLILLAAFCLGLLSQSLIAQSSNLARVYFVKVKSDHGAEFVAALKEHAAWRKQAGDPWTWIVHQVVNGKNLGDYVIRSGGHTWADLDSYEEFLGKGAVEFNKTVGPHIKSMSNTITAGDTTNVNWPSNSDDVNLISIISYHLKPGHGPAFAQAVNKYHTAIQENNREAYYAFVWNVNGGSGPRVTLALPYKNWADVQGPEESMRAFMQRILGEEEAKQLYMEFNGTYTSTESMIVRVRRDLSVIHDE